MNYQLVMKLQDLMSGPLQRISQVYTSSVGKWESLNKRFQSSFSKASQTVEQLKRKFNFGREAKNVDSLNNKLNELTKQRNLSINTSEIKAANREIERVKKQIDKLENTGKKKEGGGLLSRVAPYVGAAGLAMGAWGMAKSGMDREQTKVGYEQYLGAQAAPTIGKLDQFANITPFTNKEVYQAGQSMLAVDFKGSELIPEMTNVGNMAAGAQKDFGELSAAYAKIKAKGFIDGGELHQEFGGTRLMDQLKKNLGVDGEGLFKKAEGKEIKFADVQKALADLSADGGAYSGAMDKQSKTAAGKLSTFLGTLETKIAVWAEKLNPLLGRAFDFGTAILEQIDPMLAKLQPVFDVVVSGMGAIWDATEPVRSLIGDLFTFVMNLFGGFMSLAGGSGVLQVVFDALAAVVWVISTGINWLGSLLLWIADSPLTMLIGVIWGAVYAWGALNAIVLANPFMAVIAGIIAVVAALKYAWEHFDRFRESIIRTWAIIKSVFASMGKVLLAIALPTPENIANAMAAVKGGFGAAVAAGDAAVKADRASRQAVKAEKVAKAVAGGKPGSAGAGAGAGAGGKAPGAGGSKKVGDAGGAKASVEGAKSTNITINLKSLVESITINAGGVRDGLGDMEGQVADALLRVLNSANSIPS